MKETSRKADEIGGQTSLMLLKRCSFFPASSLLGLTICLLFCLASAGCSVPNLEKPECEAARQTVKELYSYHFGNDMRFNQNNLKARAKFLTADLNQYLTAQSDNETDYFTATADYPKAFRIGTCRVVEANKQVNFQVLLFWKDAARDEQREMHVEIVDENDRWLINKVTN